jgi:LPXTG-motif cell wall-anchored protein
MPLSFETTLCEGLLMELPHWLMVVGALLLVFGLFGLVFRKNAQVTAEPDNRDGDAETQTAQGGLTNPPSEGFAS